MIRIQIQKQAEKGLKQAPKHVQEKFLLWVELLAEHGLLHTRKRLGFHDEPLQGRRKGH
jgi:proteic killer suppression protein